MTTAYFLVGAAIVLATTRCPRFKARMQRRDEWCERIRVETNQSRLHIDALRREINELENLPDSAFEVVGGDLLVNGRLVPRRPLEPQDPDEVARAELALDTTLVAIGVVLLLLVLPAPWATVLGIMVIASLLPFVALLGLGEWHRSRTRAIRAEIEALRAQAGE